MLKGFRGVIPVGVRIRFYPPCIYYGENRPLGCYGQSCEKRGAVQKRSGMKQRVRVVGIIRQGDGILVLKRNSSRLDGVAVWELPTEKIRFGEQPEEAMTRALLEYVNVSVTDVKLKDVITFVALADASRLYNLYIIYDINLPENAEIRAKDRYSQYKYIKYDDYSVKLDDASLSVLEIELSPSKVVHELASAAGGTEVRRAMNGVTVYVDGGSRGNPGPSGIGYVVIDENGQELKRGGEFIGFATSRVAEYYALKEGMEQAIEFGFKNVRFVSDSLMLVNQMDGVYKVKNKDLLPIYNDIQKLMENFDSVAFTHVKREFNRDADAEVNIAINKHFEISEEDVARNPALFSHDEENE